MSERVTNGKVCLADLSLARHGIGFAMYHVFRLLFDDGGKNLPSERLAIYPHNVAKLNARQYKNMMTTTEVKAFAIAKALNSEPSTWGKDQAAQAMATISKLVKAGKAQDAEADAARAELGNHSATRQHLIAHGLLATTPDALSRAIEDAQKKLTDKEMADILG